MKNCGIKGADSDRMKVCGNPPVRLTLSRTESEELNLVLGRSFLRQRQNRRNAHRQMIPADVVHLGLLNQRPHMRLLQMVQLVLVCGRKMRDHASVVARNDHTAFARRMGLVHAVLGMHPGLSACFLENVGVFIFANAADVDHGVWGQHVLFEVSNRN